GPRVEPVDLHARLGALDGGAEVRHRRVDLVPQPEELEEGRPAADGLNDHRPPQLLGGGRGGGGGGGAAQRPGGAGGGGGAAAGHAAVDVAELVGPLHQRHRRVGPLAEPVGQLLGGGGGPVARGVLLVEEVRHDDGPARGRAPEVVAQPPRDVLE